MQKNKDADKAIQILTIMVSSYTIGSIFYWIILKIMSLGRVLYYEFDLVYYDYQLSYSGKFMFLIYLSGLVVGALISLVATTFGTYLWNKIKKKFQNNNGTYRQWPIMLYYLATLIVGGYALYVVIINFFPNKTLGYLVSTFTILVFVLCYSLIFIFLQDIALKVNKTAKLILVMFILFLMYIIYFNLNNEYNDARSQKSFTIIEESGSQYVVISQSNERFSTYLCSREFNGEGSYLFIDKHTHRYFKCEDVNTKVITFDNIAYWDKD